jgi:hypothetical protein
MYSMGSEDSPSLAGVPDLIGMSASNPKVDVSNRFLCNRVENLIITPCKLDVTLALEFPETYKNLLFQEVTILEDRTVVMLPREGNSGYQPRIKVRISAVQS